MPSFDHKWTRSNQSRHLRVIKLAPKIELEDLVLHRPNIAIRCRGAGVLPYPIVEVRRTYRQAIVRYKSWDSHGAFASVRQPIKRNPARIDLRATSKPLYDLLVLSNDCREQGLAQWVALALKTPETICKQVQILGSKDDITLLCQPRRDIVIGRMILDNRVRGASLEPMLEDHARSLGNRLAGFRNQQYAIGDNIIEHIEHDLVASKLLSLVNEPCSRHQGLFRKIPVSDDLLTKLLAIGFDARCELFRTGRIEVLPISVSLVLNQIQLPLLPAIDLSKPCESSRLDRFQTIPIALGNRSSLGSDRE